MIVTNSKDLMNFNVKNVLIHKMQAQKLEDDLPPKCLKMVTSREAGP